MVISHAVAPLFCFAVYSVAIAQSPSEVLWQAVEQSNLATISFAEIEFDCEISSPPMSPQQEAAIVRGQAEAIQKQIDAYADNPQIQKIFEKALAANAKVMSAQVKASSNRKISGLFRMFGGGFGGDEIYEVRVQKGNTDPFELSLLQRRLDERTLLNISFDATSRLVQVTSSPATVGVSNPLLLGRIPVIFQDVLRDKRLECSFDETYEKEVASEVCVAFQLQAEDDGLYGRAIVDPSRGYICPLFEIGTEQGQVAMRSKCSGYFQVASTEHWFPRECFTEAEMQDGITTTRYSFDPANVRLNEPLAKEIFSISVPAGAHVQYQIGESQYVTAVCGFDVGIDDLDNLLSHQCLDLEGDSASGLSNSRFLATAWGKLLVLANFLLIVVLLILYFRSNRRGRAQNV